MELTRGPGEELGAFTHSVRLACTVARAREAIETTSTFLAATERSSPSLGTLALRHDALLRVVENDAVAMAVAVLWTDHLASAVVSDPAGGANTFKRI